jgi:hypothetical protein
MGKSYAADFCNLGDQKKRFGVRNDVRVGILQRLVVDRDGATGQGNRVGENLIRIIMNIII